MVNNWVSGYYVDAMFDQFIAPSVFDDGGTWKLIAGNYNGTWNGWYWNGSTWIRDSSIVTGLPNLGFITTCGIFTLDSTLKLIGGDSSGYPVGYYWNGSSWISDGSIVTGLGYLTSPSFTLFYESSVLKLIIGHYNSIYSGYYWNGSSWISDSSIVTGLSAVDVSPAPTIFDDGGTWKILEGHANGNCYGWYWNGSTWIRDDTVASGISDVGTYAHPCVYLDGSQLRVIIGNEWWGLRGYAKAPTYTIFGNVKDDDGNNLNNVTITLEDGTDYSTSTDASGNYSQIVDADIYTVTASLAGYLNGSASVDASSADQTQNFTLLKPVISGTVYTSQSNPISSATVRAAGGSYYPTTSDSAGAYSLTVDPGIYNVTASKTNYHSDTQSIDASSSDQTQDFTLTNPQASLSGGGGDRVIRKMSHHYIMTKTGRHW